MFITHYSDFTCGVSGFFKSKAIGPFARHHWNYLGGPIDAMASSWTLTTRNICVYNSGLWTKISSITVHDVSIWSVRIKSILTLIIFMEYPYAFSLFSCHYIDVIMTTVASQITSLAIIYSTVQADTDKKNIIAPRHWPLCGEFTGTGEFPTQMASYAENVSIWWRHHVGWLHDMEKLSKLLTQCGALMFLSFNMNPLLNKQSSYMKRQGTHEMPL